jgi:hypothetical protein
VEEVAARSALLAEISALMDAPGAGQRAPYLEQIERALTDGYAQALALEAERARLRRRLGETAAAVGDPDGDGPLAELASLARDIERADEDLARLRVLLGDLRTLASRARAS